MSICEHSSHVQGVLVEYGALQPLPAATLVAWRVQIWDGLGVECGWSAAAQFETALLSPSDWATNGSHAGWLGMPSDARDVPASAPPTNSCSLFDSNPAPLFRTEFAVPGDGVRSVRSARLHVTGLGYYEVSIDGQRVGQSR